MAKSKSKEVALPWRKALAKHAKRGAAPKEKPITSDWISTDGNKFTVDGKDAGRELDCVVIAWNFENRWYGGRAYKKGDASTPTCFAIGYDEDELAPHDDSPSPYNKYCEGCELNEFGSGVGDGKECSNRRRLALIVASKKDTPVLKGLNIPWSSVKNWKKFAATIDDMGLEPMQSAVRVHFDDNADTQHHPLIFEFANEITNEKMLGGLSGMLEKAEKLIESPYDASNYEAPNKGGKKKTASKKKSKFTGNKTATKGKKKSKFS